jgi:hypothetical protein
VLEGSIGKETPQYLGGTRELVDILAKQREFDHAGVGLVEGQGLVEKMSRPYKEEENEAMTETAENYQSARKRLIPGAART